MPEVVNQEVERDLLLEKYLQQIPVDLYELLAPRRGQEPEFAVSVKSLRIKEEERSYVMAIQQHYDLPLRPNETVKRTMIRVRLEILKRRREAEAEGQIIDSDFPLPVDPLE